MSRVAKESSYWGKRKAGEESRELDTGGPSQTQAKSKVRIIGNSKVGLKIPVENTGQACPGELQEAAGYQHCPTTSGLAQQT